MYNRFIHKLRRHVSEKKVVFFFNVACVPLEEVLSHVWETVSALGSPLAATSPKKAKEKSAWRTVPGKCGEVP